MKPPVSATPPPSDDALKADHARVLTEWLGKPITSIERIGGGRNSRVYRIELDTGVKAAKFYFGKTADGRDRLDVEYSALEFLWRNGLRCIPRPIASNSTEQVGLYEYIEGDAVEAATATAADIDQLAGFAGQLKELAESGASGSLGPAAEAFFSIGGVIGNITERYHRMAALDVPGTAYDQLQRFLTGEFEPALTRLGEWARSRAGNDPDLQMEHRTLSPSDLGFHNALRKSDGALSFLDFEYFGWDDPVKMLSDALLHPRMRLADKLRSRLAARFSSVFGRDTGWRERVETMYPLFGLKWCMILLNEFRPEQLQRRRFVDENHEAPHAVQIRQLEAARQLLGKITGEHPRFPFWQ